MEVLRTPHAHELGTNPMIGGWEARTCGRWRRAGRRAALGLAGAVVLRVGLAGPDGARSLAAGTVSGWCSSRCAARPAPGRPGRASRRSAPACSAGWCSARSRSPSPSAGPRAARPGGVPAWAAVVTLVAVAEELLLRGVLFDRLRRTATWSRSRHDRRLRRAARAAVRARRGAARTSRWACGWRAAPRHQRSAPAAARARRPRRLVAPVPRRRFRPAAVLLLAAALLAPAYAVSRRRPHRRCTTGRASRTSRTARCSRPPGRTRPRPPGRRQPAPCSRTARPAPARRHRRARPQIAVTVPPDGVVVPAGAREVRLDVQPVPLPRPGPRGGQARSNAYAVRLTDERGRDSRSATGRARPSCRCGSRRSPSATSRCSCSAPAGWTALPTRQTGADVYDADLPGPGVVVVVERDRFGGASGGPDGRRGRRGAVGLPAPAAGRAAAAALPAGGGGGGSPLAWVDAQADGGGPRSARLFERLMFSFMGPPQLGDLDAASPCRGTPPRTSAPGCGRRWDEHEIVRTDSRTYANCPPAP